MERWKIRIVSGDGIKRMSSTKPTCPLDDHLYKGRIGRFFVSSNMKCSTSPKIKKFGCDLDDDEKYQKMKAVEEKKAEVAKDCKGKKKKKLAE